jgi:hypothetical protein
VSQKLAERAARFLGGRTSRRSFLQKTALVSTAVAVVGREYVLRPGSAYAAICACAGQDCPCGSLCCDGYTEFCCTLTGQNGCPPGTIAAGWWKADGSRFCNGPRYYIDCNATCRCGGGPFCPDGCSNAPWGCGCAGGNCAHRKAGCTNFRYGQCNQQVATVGRIACRVVSCDPAVLIVGNCAPTLAVDNSTANHNQPCLQAPARPTARGKKMQLVFSDATGDTWFVTDGIHRRPLAAGEPQLLVDLGLITPERDVWGNIRPKWISGASLARIPLAK